MGDAAPMQVVMHGEDGLPKPKNIIRKRQAKFTPFTISTYLCDGMGVLCIGKNNGANM